VTATGLIYTALPRATCGLVVTDGRIADAPPYLRRTIGRNARQVWRELHQQADRIEWLPDQLRPQVHRSPVHCFDAGRDNAIAIPTANGTTRIAAPGFDRDTKPIRAAIR
jgi:hypothetical protein